jgi:hypothetical protein
VLISTVGLGWCFIGNAASFCFVIAHDAPLPPRAELAHA